jgi:hypothetical protein
MSKRSKSDIKEALTILGLDTSKNFVEHFRHLVKAQEIYQERYDKYQDEPIRRMGWRGVLTEIRKGADRAFLNWNKGHIKNPDDFLDIINYCVHALRQSKAGNRDGAWWTILDAAGSSRHRTEHPQEDGGDDGRR